MIPSPAQIKFKSSFIRSLEKAIIGERALAHTRPDERQHTRAAAQQYQQVETDESWAEGRLTSRRS